MCRLSNVKITELKELQIQPPQILPDKELALKNRKTIAELKLMEGNLKVKVLITYQIYVIYFSINKYDYEYIIIYLTYYFVLINIYITGFIPYMFLQS